MVHRICKNEKAINIAYNMYTGDEKCHLYLDHTAYYPGKLCLNLTLFFTFAYISPHFSISSRPHNPPPIHQASTQRSPSKMDHYGQAGNNLLQHKQHGVHSQAPIP